MSARLKIDRSVLGEIAHEQLTREFIDGMLEDPEAPVLTPAWAQSRATVAEIVNDNFSGTGGEEALNELLRIARNAAKGVDVKLQACAWIDREAKRFAEQHASDRAAEIEADQ